MAQNQINLSELDKMLDILADQSWAQSATVWALPFCQELARECQRLSEEGHLQKAAIGFGNDKSIQSQVRGDFTHWIDPEKAEGVQIQFLRALQQIQHGLNRSFYLGLNSFETHFALYPAKAGYDKHIDNHRGSSARKITFVLYLNENWQEGDGGELSLFEPDDDQKKIAQLPPLLGHFVLFRSEIFPHQVEKSVKSRLSLTGWFRNDAL